MLTLVCLSERGRRSESLGCRQLSCGETGTIENIGQLIGEAPLAGSMREAKPIVQNTHLDILSKIKAGVSQPMTGNAMQRAVWRYGWERFAALARKVIYRLQRLDASGIFGDDHQHKTLWDEFCHEAQWGPSDDQIDSAWGMTIRPFLKPLFHRYQTTRRLCFSSRLTNLTRSTKMWSSPL
jgi:hypothetical protein